jgi:site-specific DNA recombinase
MTPTPKAAGYIRVSTQGQAAEGESLSTQRKQIEAYAQSKGWELLKIYSDEGISGSKAANRPGLNKLMNDCSTGSYQYMIITKLSRLVRNTRDLLSIHDELKAHGTNIVSITENIDLSTHTGELILTVLAGIAQWERDVIREQMSENKMARWRDHRTFVGRVPFGYTWNGEKKKLEIDDGEAEVYRRIVGMYLHQGMSSEDIAIQLRKEGIRCKKAYFTYASILYMFKNPAYYGFYPLNKYVYKDDKKLGAGGKRSKELKPADQHIMFPIPNPLISKTEWDAIQERTGFNTLKSKRVNTSTANFWLRDVLHCEHCGARMGTVTARERKDGTSLRYYRCYWAGMSKKKLEANSKEQCHLPYVHADALEEAVWSRLLSKLRLPFYRREAIDPLAVSNKYEVQINTLESELSSLVEDHKKFQKARDKLYALYENDHIDQAELASRLSDKQNEALSIEGKIAEIRKRIDNLRQVQENDRAYAEFIRDKGAAIDRMLREMERLNPADKKRGIESLIQGHIEVCWDPAKAEEDKLYGGDSHVEPQWEPVADYMAPPPSMSERQYQGIKDHLDVLWSWKVPVPQQPEIFFAADFRFNREIFQWLFDQGKISPISDPESSPPTGGGIGKKNGKKINGKETKGLVQDDSGHLLVHSLKESQFFR